MKSNFAGTLISTKLIGFVKMRLFQMIGFGQDYLRYYSKSNIESHDLNFEKRKFSLLKDRYGASHILKPVYDNDENCFFTVCDDLILQYSWARSKNIPKNKLDLEAILYCQIEEHKAEVLYNNHPIGFPSSFVKRLPGCVKKVIAWRAAPVGNADLSAYDAVVSNFDSLNANWRAKGWKSVYFSPSWDPEMESYAANKNRSNDLFFAGSYSRTTGHDDRLEFLNTVASMSDHLKIDLHLLHRKWGRLADQVPWRWIPVPIRLPSQLNAIVRPPVFGREMYQALSQAKIVINPATDIAGDERGNMRCWEALGCGACMISSAGRYPEGFEAGVHFETFTNTDELLHKIKELLADEPRMKAIANAGTDMIKSKWSKENQWNNFIKMVSNT